MIPRVTVMGESEASAHSAPVDEAGLGALRTERGNLPLDRVDLSVDIVGLTSRSLLTQEFVNVHTVPLEATYVFPLPDRAAVTSMRMTAAGRVVEAKLRERGEAREEYDEAVAAGRRAAIAEEERPDVFTMRVGNIGPGERISVELTLAGALPVEDGEATFRFPLVVAPRYIPGAPLAGDSVGDGYAEDTEAVPDASRITPPVLLPGFPNPVRLAIDVGVDPAGLPIGAARCSLHTIVSERGRIRIQPGERLDRDFVLRLGYGAPPEPPPGTAVTDSGGQVSTAEASLVVVRDPEGSEGTYQFTVLPPPAGHAAVPRDVVLLLDRSGSMEGWKMVAARRAAARIVDTLLDADRFAVLAFDTAIETPSTLPGGLVAATDRNRYRAVEHLSSVEARGGTKLLEPLRRALELLTGDTQRPASWSRPGEAITEVAARDLVVVLVTDGQVGDEDRILREAADGLRRVRVHTVGIDQAVNAGFLGRLASAGGGRCELVESEDRLDEAMARIHSRIATPLVTNLRLAASGLTPIEESVTPTRLPGLFPGVPFVVSGRFTEHGASEATGDGGGSVTLSGVTRDGRPWSVTAGAGRRDAPAITAIWARGVLRDLEDQYAALGARPYHEYEKARRGLERRIVETSLRFGVLCRFTAYVAVDSRASAPGGAPLTVVQPVECPAGWRARSGGSGGPVVRLAASAPMMIRLDPPGRGRRAGSAPGAAPRGSIGAATSTGFGSAAGRDESPTLGVPPGAGVPGAGSSGIAGAGGPGDPAEAGRVPTMFGSGEPLSRLLSEIREFAVTEAVRLRGAEDDPAHRRRESLDDLASRAAALARAAAAVQRTALGENLTRLVELLRPERLQQARELAEFDALWGQALRILDAMAAGDLGETSGEPSPARERRRRPFWKR